MKRQQPTTITPLLTPWGENAAKGLTLQEYPRPQLRRQDWQNLNGLWRYAIREDDQMPVHWDGDIRVPFSPESILSGVQRSLLPHQTLWYERSIDLPALPQGQRWILHFGAVDQTCCLWVNDRRVGGHEGGYLPFSFDITDYLTEGANILRLKVNDLTDQGPEAYGKQKLERGGIWYTGQSGIWQTVWLEPVPENHITSLRITPRLEESCVVIELLFAGAPLPYNVNIYAQGALAAQGESQGEPLCLPLHNVHPWSPEDPFLYDVEITAGEDRIESYFGMRSFGFARGAHGRRVLTLNGKPIFHHGLLDQGYWSDGLYTPPSDEAMIQDITQAKAMGFNMLRKHIKIEPLRWYYHCDRLGMLVWQDFVSGGGPYHPLMIQVLPWLGFNFKDSLYNFFGRRDPAGRACFRRDAKATVELLYSCVGLCCWVPFNEGWGQFDAALAALEVKAADPTRYVDHASGYHDQGTGDFQSSHIYYKSYRPRRDKHDRVMALTEFGGFSLAAPGHMSSDTLFGYKGYQSHQELADAWKELYTKQVLPAIAKGLSADVYTQVSDVEDEINGLVTYDRHEVKLDESTAAAMGRALQAAFQNAFEGEAR